MRCPVCQYPDSKVLDSRPANEGREIRRRRECLQCHQRFTSYERIEEAPIWVVKKDGQRESFNRAKILRGMLTACEKRPITLEQLEQVAEAVEREVRDQHTGEVSSQHIGQLVMNRLQVVDQVAYVRFASVYRQFTDIEGFRQELERLIHPHHNQEG
ncbi:MAG: transcriptional repressor NrdR [Sulfobacillus thermosulfidooxidans]|uniref:Transcriptional repressor NrdR n=1 Tax=Sulfobacillus thermotolerans TaxID=338644 RepID=A0ABM6RTB7_9FIRM|nr:transcriptional regulator NrdR [Sulfobacillus sp. hq2]AUW94605.1 transcriptional regulator NrdR [Sulfobacillus thermotolerans]MCY0908429.1 transcriptional regulator NrdR [Sulfobacillus thermotolerans]POB09102.1 transcriptional regulator NrdR [Sulfobacillus sp. hq2]PSR37756.1 MAG: transcriptional repressor NrdR [Sulfobacillus thermosulfidooxidans]